MPCSLNYATATIDIKLKLTAKTRVTRELTCEERVQYLHEEKVCPTPTPVRTLTPLPTPTVVR